VSQLRDMGFADPAYRGTLGLTADPP
jgi:hypothetical protein